VIFGTLVTQDVVRQLQSVVNQATQEEAAVGLLSSEHRDTWAEV
jgi:hypothetical protein